MAYTVDEHFLLLVLLAHFLRVFYTYTSWSPRNECYRWQEMSREKQRSEVVRTRLPRTKSRLHTYIRLPGRNP